MSKASRIPFGDGTVERVGPDTSDVGKRLNETPPEEPSNCLICDADDVKMPAVAHSMVDTFKEGEEAVFTIRTCRLHTARWKYLPSMTVHDGQHR